MDLGIKGRRAIVTGGSSGIGFETARQFLEEGVRVLITGRNQQKLEKARNDLTGRTGGEVHAIVADMPPTTTTTKASPMATRSVARLAGSRATWSAPPNPASAAPSANTEVNRTA